MKPILSSAIIFIFLSSFLNAQNLVNYIPKDATSVVRVKGSKFKELITLDEFNRTEVGKGILEMIFEDQKDDRKIQDTGFDFSSDIYYFNQITDSTFFNSFWIGIKNVDKWESFIREKSKKEIQYNGNVRILTTDKNISIWDNKKLLLIKGELEDSFFTRDSVREARYGIREMHPYDYYSYYEKENRVDTIELNNEVSPSDSVASETEELEIKERQKETDIYDYKYLGEEDSDSYEGYDWDRDTYSIEKYNEHLSEQKKIKKELLNKWLRDYAYSTFHKSLNAPSIMNNPDYTKSIDEESAISYFISIPKISYIDIWNNGGLFPYSSLFFVFQSYHFYGIESLKGNLYLNKEDARLVTQVKVSKEQLTDYKKLYKHKINKKFFNYVDGGKAIGFIGFAIDNEKYLELYPKWLARVMSGIAKDYSEEANLVADLFSLLLDEKAVAKVIKGDALLVINDVNSQEVTYKTYEYDDDYNATEVEKTKKQTIPEFLLMVSSEDPAIIEKFLKYGEKKEVIEFKNGIYSLQDLERLDFFKFHVLFKDGIVFLGNSYEAISKIKTNSYSVKINKDQKKLLKKNNAALYFDPKKLMNRIPREEFSDIEDFLNFHIFLDSMGKVYASSSGMEGEDMTAEMVWETGKEDQNSLKYFLKLTEMLLDM